MTFLDYIVNYFSCFSLRIICLVSARELLRDFTKMVKKSADFVGGGVTDVEHSVFI
jgi:hypothetical protein